MARSVFAVAVLTEYIILPATAVQLRPPPSEKSIESKRPLVPGQLGSMVTTQTPLIPRNFISERTTPLNSEGRIRVDTDWINPGKYGDEEGPWPLDDHLHRITDQSKKNSDCRKLLAKRKVRRGIDKFDPKAEAAEDHDEEYHAETATDGNSCLGEIAATSSVNCDQKEGTQEPQTEERGPESPQSPVSHEKPTAERSSVEGPVSPKEQEGVPAEIKGICATGGNSSLHEKAATRTEGVPPIAQPRRVSSSDDESRVSIPPEVGIWKDPFLNMMAELFQKS